MGRLEKLEAMDATGRFAILVELWPVLCPTCQSLLVMLGELYAEGIRQRQAESPNTQANAVKQ